MTKSTGPNFGFNTGYSPVQSRSRSRKRARPPSVMSADGGRVTKGGVAQPVCATFATRSDIDGGVAGGLGLLQLSVSVIGLEVGARFRDPLDEAERLSFGFGVGAVRSAALVSAFQILVVSSPFSLGDNREDATALLEFLDGRGILVFGGCCGFVDVDLLEAYYAQA